MTKASRWRVAAVIPIVGYLSDRVGTKLIFLTALILFTAGSALCAFAPTKEALILAVLVLPGQKTEPENQARPAGRNRFDIPGLLLSMVGFSVLVYGLTSAGSKGWGNATVLALIVGRDPAVRAYQEARARGEEVTPERLPAMSE